MNAFPSSAEARILGHPLRYQKAAFAAITSNKRLFPRWYVPSYVATDLADCLQGKGMYHERGTPHHPQPQGKIERWHQTMTNRVLLENDHLPVGLERQIGAFADYYNNHRYHESLANLTPADV